MSRLDHALFRSGLLVSSAVGIFWVLWLAFVGAVPTYELFQGISFLPKIQLSRLWDPVFIFIGVNALVRYFVYMYKRVDESLSDRAAHIAITACAMFGLFFSFSISSIFGIGLLIFVGGGNALLVSSMLAVSIFVGFRIFGWFLAVIFCKKTWVGLFVWAVANDKK